MKIKSSLAVSDSGFVFDPTTGDSFSLNDTGRKIVELMKEGKSEQEISEYFIDNYEIDKDTFEKNFIDFTAMLQNIGLLTQ